MFISDNLPFLRSLDNESIDLVCIDPPFGKKQTFEGKLREPLTPDERRIERELMASWGVYDAGSAYEVGIEFPDQEGVTAKFNDIWSFRSKVYEESMDRLRTRCPGVFHLINATRHTHGDSRAAYIAFMAERMIEVRRILKLTGSVFLHCDHEANAYLRQMMDAVFNHANFRRELIWNLKTASGYKTSVDNFVRSHETILYYVKQRQASVFNKAYAEYSDEYKARFRKIDDEGRRYRDDRGGGRRQYLDDSPGIPLTDVWDDIMAFQQNTASPEVTGYPTQKPQALARRVIEASTNPGDVVLDCFAGCAYVPVAAQIAGRRWIACDMSPRAWTIVRRQFRKLPALGIVTEGENPHEPVEKVMLEPRLATANRIIKIRGPNELPERTTVDEPSQRHNVHLPKIKFRQRPMERGDDIWRAFVSEWGPQCWYCGTEKQCDRRELHLDHIEPNRQDGSNDDCWNRALACAICNSNKSDTHTPQQTIRKARDDGLIKTDALYDEALERFARRRDWARLRWETVIKPRKGGRGDDPQSEERSNSTAED